MTGFLVFLAFALLLVPLVETLWDPLWTRATARVDAPSRRLHLITARMVCSLVFSAALSFALLWTVYHAPRSHPLLPGGIIECLGHGLEHGPGTFTVVFLFCSTLGLGLVLVALFYPLPSFPPGVPRPDLAHLLGGRGVEATVECLPGLEPACWSEVTPYPRVLLVGGIETRLPAEELAAVLDHEASHLVAGDHRARIWARAYRRLLFFFEGASTLFDTFVHEQERRADDQVIAWDPNRRSPLRRALLSLATLDFPADPEPLVGATPLGALGHAAWSVKQRIARLAGGPEESPPCAGLRFWPFLGLAMVISVATSAPGACTLHCLIDSLP